MAAATAMLDEVHGPLSPPPPQDNNIYSLGHIGSHNVVLVCLGTIGTASAAVIASQMRSTFTSIQCGLLVGVAGGAPNPAADIRLGDVVVSKPSGSTGGVIQYDFGKTVRGGRFERTKSLNKPSPALLGAVASLETRCLLEQVRLSKHLSGISTKYPRLREAAVYPGAALDILFDPKYDHKGAAVTCISCDNEKLIHRPPRTGTDPVIHFGLIASANQVMKHGATRDRLQKELGVLCFEMEAAGLMDIFPFLVVRGICGYSDSHKNKQWQSYAALTAASCAKELVLTIPTSDVAEKPAAKEKERVHPPIVSGLASPTPKGAIQVHDPMQDIRDSFFRKPRNPNFTGRKGGLRLIDYRLKEAADQGCDYPHRVVIHGLGGVGKTQCVTEYCHRAREERKAEIFWFTATGLGELVSQYQEPARAIRRFVDQHKGSGKHKDVISRLSSYLQPGQETDLVKAWISSQDDWILVFDNFDTISLDVQKRSIGTIAMHGFELSNPPQADAELLFMRQRHQGSGVLHSDVRQHSEYGAIRDIVRDLAGFPLALSQAAAFIRENDPLTCAEYLELLTAHREDREDLLRFKEANPEYPESVMTTWEITLDYLMKNRPDAAALLQLLGFFAHTDIPEDVLYLASKSCLWTYGTYQGSRILDKKWLSEIQFLMRRSSFRINVGVLSSLSLVTRDATHQSLSLHPLVHEWIRTRLNHQPDELSRCINLCGILIYQAYPLQMHRSAASLWHPEPNAHNPTLQRLYPHMQGFALNLARYEQAPNGVPLEVRSLLLALCLSAIAEFVISSRTNGVFQKALTTVLCPNSSALAPPSNFLGSLQAGTLKALSKLHSLWNLDGRTMREIEDLLVPSPVIKKWTPDKAIYLVMFTSLIMAIINTVAQKSERGVFYHPDLDTASNHEPSKLTMERNRPAVALLTRLVVFFSRLGENVPEEISFLETIVKHKLCSLMSFEQYWKLAVPPLTNGLSLAHFSHLEIRAVSNYFDLCCRMHHQNSKGLTDLLLHSDVKNYIVPFKETSREWCEAEDDRRFSTPYISNSFGRNDQGRPTSVIARPPDFAEAVTRTCNSVLSCVDIILSHIISSKQAINTESFQKLIDLVRLIDDVGQGFQGWSRFLDIAIMEDLLGNPAWMRGMNKRFAMVHFIHQEYIQSLGHLTLAFQAETILEEFPLRNSTSLIPQTRPLGIPRPYASAPHTISLRGILPQRFPAHGEIKNGDHTHTRRQTLQIEHAKWMNQYDPSAINAPDTPAMLELWITCMSRLDITNEDDTRAQWLKKIQAISAGCVESRSVTEEYELLDLIYQLAKASKNILFRIENAALGDETKGGHEGGGEGVFPIDDWDVD
ncbi:hypothetical protein FQN55_004487 [Onygenales sp. PD_40]|nr:hypothetical protein FQN55_004487 [Onygenales sp. PD_40]